MGKKKLIGLGVVMVVLVGALLLDPTFILIGFLRGQHFYRGRPTQFWKKALGDTDPAVHAAALRQLKEGGAEAVPVLVEIWSEEGNSEWEAIEVRCKAGGILSQIGPGGETAVRPLVRALKDQDPHIRAVAITALGSLGPCGCPEVVPALIDRLETEDRQAAARALSRFGSQALPAVPALEKLLQDPDAGVRWNAARTLGKIGPQAAGALSSLIASLKDEDALVRENAAEALGDIGPPAGKAVAPLVALLNDKEGRVRRDATRALGLIGAASRSALPALQRLLKDKNPEVREAAAKAIQRISQVSPSK
jgi:HEAT repeat protein